MLWVHVAGDEKLSFNRWFAISGGLPTVLKDLVVSQCTESGTLDFYSVSSRKLVLTSPPPMDVSEYPNDRKLQIDLTSYLMNQIQ